MRKIAPDQVRHDINVVLDQIKLYRKIAPVISKIQTERNEREQSDEFNRRVRTAHNFLRMAGNRKQCLLYYEATKNREDCKVADHVVPLSALYKLVKNDDLSIERAIISPVALITAASHNKLSKAGLGKTSPCFKYPFKRYSELISVETYLGEVVIPETWDIKKHISLIKGTQYRNLIHRLGLENSLV